MVAMEPRSSRHRLISKDRPFRHCAGPGTGDRRNSLSGPGYEDVDASLSKGFGLPKIRGLGENARFELRADVYNVFNKTNLNVSSIDANLVP